jgi:Ca2+-dependent lipid-binding protein
MLDRIEENMEIYLNNSINSIVIDTTLHKECSICLEKYTGIFTEPTLSLSVVIDNLYNNIKNPATVTVLFIIIVWIFGYLKVCHVSYVEENWLLFP